ncbi:hypothetical protein EW145_g3318 [Phellinidium pouzarii]|uniref:Major facilitator superfamily (MFS) profile domain-containing protein n=1 Tax=Phellinidium pouzarii TaxID=167371 RepID=A0A4S4L7G6_9AGAM|nr:hypothetical protein EW145_g3318 [Phellinidium pouzarii]
MIGAGIFSMLRAVTALGASIGFQIFASIGIEILPTCSSFLAPTPLSPHASALAFFMLIRFFSQSWGISIGGVVLQNELAKRLPLELSQFPGETSIAFSVVPAIPELKEPLKSEVRAAFADSLTIFIYACWCSYARTFSEYAHERFTSSEKSDEYRDKIDERLRRELNLAAESTGTSVALSDAKENIQL